MKIVCFLLLCLAPGPLPAQNAQPLRLFLRAGPKTHGPGQHDGPRWLAEWKPMLASRGAKVEGAVGFPTAEQLDNTDVLVLYSAEGGAIAPEQRQSLDKFLKRGGGLVAIHDSVCGNDAQWFKTVIGGAWEHGHSKWFEGDVSIYYTDKSHPITKDVSNFDFDDEIYWDLHMMPEARVLAATYAPDRRNTKGGRIYPSVYDIVPQMWVYEKELPGASAPYRAFVCIPGHMHKSFNLPHFRAVLLRGIAWAGKREVDSLCDQEELASVRYPEGGPTAPEKAAAKLVVHPDFNIRLVAAEPLINKVISLDWDARGRMWVAETPEYPNGRRINANDKVIAGWKEKDPSSFIEGKEQRPAHDRISVLEDPDAQGRYQKKSVFYEGLELVTSLALFRDGAIVSQAPDILFLRDIDGDGKADKVERLYTGFGVGDTHAVISNLRWGLDGWIYATVGYSRGDIYSGDRSKHFGQITEGVIRFKPDGSALEQVSSKGSNTWGMDFGADGEIFFTQATSGDHINHVVMPERALARGKIGSTPSFKVIQDHRRSFPVMAWEKQAYVQIDVVGGFTAVAGSCLYTGGAWPAKYENAHFCSDPTINIVHMDLITPSGVSYLASKESGREEEEFIGSRDLWFRAIHSRVGPDGALYVVDFYNQAVVHNDTRGTRHGANNAAVRPDRDHYFGRIWRVEHKQAKRLEAPSLAEGTREDLVKALNHPNRWVRITAQRLLVEQATQGGPAELPQTLTGSLQELASDGQASPYARIHALWSLQNLQASSSLLLAKLATDSSPAVRKNALRIIAAGPADSRSLQQGERAETSKTIRQAALSRLSDPEPRLRLEALLALGSLEVDAATATQVVDAYEDFKDPWLASAAVALASKAPLEFLKAVFVSGKQDALKIFATQISSQLAAKQDAILSRDLAVSLAGQPASSDPLKQIVLESLAKGLRPETAPPWTPELQKAFQSLLASPNPGLTAAAVALVARWDARGVMAGDLKGFIQQLSVRLEDPKLPEEERAQVVTSLLSVRRMNANILPSIAKIVDSTGSPGLQKKVIETLGAIPDPAVGAVLVESYSKVAPQLQDAIFAQLIKRSEWSLALVEALKNGKVKPTALGPVAVGRLRAHSDKAVARTANTVLDELRGPEVKEKNALIAQLTPEVEKPANTQNGHTLFSQNCAVCHLFKGEGKDIAPDLTGMGAKGAEELLVHVLDPNRYVEPNFFAYSIETKDGETVDGIIGRENQASVVLRNASGDVEIKTGNIKSRRNTGLSLMPNGFEALGAEGLRDLLGFICADENRFRVLDLKNAFTASSTRGIYAGAELLEDTLRFKKYGLIRAGEVPFEVVSPSRSAGGNNLVVLKGGSGVAKTMPQTVEIDRVGVKASRLHFLGGVGGWAWPCCGDNKNENMPVLKATLHFADSQKEEILFKNGVEFVDWISPANEVPGSKQLPGLVQRGQVRWFTKPVLHQAVLQKITLESFDNGVAPTLVAITAETGEAKTAATGTTESQTGNVKLETPAVFEWGHGIRVLSVGGGSSHDFGRWFGLADKATLTTEGKANLNYTERPSAILPNLKSIDVLYLSSNQAMPDVEMRQGIFAFANSGKGLLLVHPALWYNWKDWPEYNRALVGGGARSHDKFEEFEVTVEDASHPIMAGVPANFKITDELYHFEREEQGTPIQILATGKSPLTGKTFPVAWIVKHAKARIACLTLGHDGKAHEHPAFKMMLQNSLAWAAAK